MLGFMSYPLLLQCLKCTVEYTSTHCLNNKHQTFMELVRIILPASASRQFLLAHFAQLKLKLPDKDQFWLKNIQCPTIVSSTAYV